METIRPATTRGPISGSNVRVIIAEDRVAVVSSKSTTFLNRDGDVERLPGGKLEIPTTEGTLTCVKQGGCSCGKPWLTRPGPAEIMAQA